MTNKQSKTLPLNHSRGSYRVPEAKIKLPEIKMIALKNLRIINNGIQRSECKGHTMTMEKAIRESGFMDVVKVFPMNEDGTYDIAESTHRFRSIRNIHIDNLDVEIPCAILWWKNKDDRDEIQKTIIDFNVNNKDWETFDYVQSHAAADWRNPRVHKTFVEILKEMKDFQKISVSNGVVASIYTKSLRNHDVLKNHEQAKSFYIKSNDRQYINVIISTLKQLRLDHGKKDMSAPFLRKYVYHLWRKARELQYDYNEWYLFVDKSTECIDMKLSDPHITSMPADDDAFDAWFKTIKVKKSKKIVVSY